MEIKARGANKNPNNTHDHSKSLVLLKSSIFDQNAGKFLFVVNTQQYRDILLSNL